MLEAKSVKIMQNFSLAEAMYQLVLYAPDIAAIAKPGQFVHLAIPGDPSKLLRRPISIHLVDRKSAEVSLVYQVVGDGTRRLTGVKAGEQIDCLGPLGRGYSVENAQTIYLVGGGCGIAPLRFVPAQWPDRQYTSFLGYRNRTASYLTDAFEKISECLHIATNDGSLGEAGFVTDLLLEGIHKKKPDLILACGPDPMLKKIQRIAADQSIPCQLSLEERMGCGIGGCLVCACATNSGGEIAYKRVCADGPVFDSQEVIFDDQA